MNSFVSKEEMTRRIKKVALHNEITSCNEGISALKRYRAKLREKLRALGAEKCR